MRICFIDQLFFQTTHYFSNQIPEPVTVGPQFSDIVYLYIPWQNCVASFQSFQNWSNHEVDNGYSLRPGGLG